MKRLHIELFLALQFDEPPRLQQGQLCVQPYVKAQKNDDRDAEAIGLGATPFGRGVFSCHENTHRRASYAVVRSMRRAGEGWDALGQAAGLRFGSQALIHINAAHRGSGVLLAKFSAL